MKDTTVVNSKLYPIISNSLDKNSRKFIANIATFMNNRHTEVHATSPCTRIVFNQKDVDNIFKSLNINEQDVLKILKESIYFGDSGYNPQCAREPYVEVLMCAIRYYIKNNESKNAELTTIFLCFSGKLYASLHALFWKYPPKEEIMDYVINNMLTDKFDLKREGTIFKSIQKLSITWITTYKSKLEANSSDDNMGKLLQQLRDRVKSFLNNIATVYYEAAESKNYMNYETDSLDEDDFRLTSNDATTAARITAAAVSVLTSQKIDIDLCSKCLYHINTIKAPELCDIMEAIVADKNNIPEIRRVINIIICDFMANPENRNKRVGGADFISYSIKAKPNTKSAILLEMKSTIINWLCSYAVEYKRRSARRPATGNDYFRAVLTYLVFTICKVSN